MSAARDEQTFAVIGAAMEVHRRLGCGFLEAVYHEAMAIELGAREIPHAREVALPVRYRGQLLATGYRADLICYASIVVELKAVDSLAGLHQAQLINYLRASGMQRGLLINFGGKSLEHKRLVLAQR